MEQDYVNERLDHLGIVAGVCQELGLAAWLDAQEPTNRQQVSVGTATVAMILNGLGWSLRQLYLVPQFFVNKPVEHLLGAGMTAEMLNDDCLGRTLDWLYAHDLTKLFAGIATRARQLFGIKADQVHVDTTSFSVSGEYTGAQEGADETVIAITYGYSRDHRQDLKQWMLALATTHDGDVPLFMQPLDGNRSDKVSLLAAITAIQTQLREAGFRWVSRVSETSMEAKALLQEGSESWQQSEDGTVHWFSRELKLPQGEERWVVVYTQESLQRAQQSMQRQVSKVQTAWEQKCWHLGNRRFACQADARDAFERELKEKPAWLNFNSDSLAHPQYGGKGRPRKGASPVGQQLIATYKGQGSPERGFRFLKDPLFLASSVFVKKPERIMALSFIMVLCEARSIA